MSLAIYAAQFDNNNSDNDNAISKKRSSHNRTQKRYPKTDIDSKKVNNVLESIHNNSLVNEEGDGLDDYYGNPPPKPMSIGSQRASTKEGMQNNSSNLGTLGAKPSESYKVDDYDLSNYESNYGDEKTAEEYYKKYVPNFSAALLQSPNKGEQKKAMESFIKQYGYNNNDLASNSASVKTQNGSAMMYTDNNDVLIQKLNYMINLLEEKQDERTGNVTEEVVLYSFLGIFIIFIVDSFARSGKYRR